ncbi:MAG: hypothetical protein A2293_01655 [Elusimicrobia bacterium RIFOXYB2_FULL_49_7]|nr:MAG: hypothetical protein A2293_01655 [Elusimicrobia bacterium RIFOXYB2_FULL_49_7]
MKLFVSIFGLAALAVFPSFLFSEECSDGACDTARVNAILEANGRLGVPLSSVITGSATGRITKLNFQACSLSVLPNDIGALSELKELYVINGTLSALPDTICRLSKLEVLQAYNNRLTQLPDLSALSNLTTLSVATNRLTSLCEFSPLQTRLSILRASSNKITALPSSIGNLTGLIELNLGSDSLSVLPDEMANCTKLKYLYVNNNKLTTLPAWITTLAGLRYLYSGVNRLTALPDLTLLDSLVIVSVNNNQLTQLWNFTPRQTLLTNLIANNNRLTDLPVSVANLKGLYNLNLGYNNLTALPDEIGRCANMQYLSVNNNQLLELPLVISSLSKLSSLNCQYNQLTVLPDLSGLTALTTVVVNNNRLTRLWTFSPSQVKLSVIRAGYNPIAELPANIDCFTALTELNLAYDSLLSLPEELGHCLNLKYLTVNNNRLTSLPASLSHCTQFVSLTCSYNQIPVLPEWRDMDNLTTLLVNNNRLTALPEFGPGQVKLATLRAGYNFITALPASISHLTGLVELNLASDSLSLLPEGIGNFVNLKYLTISNNKLTALPDTLRNLKKLITLALQYNQIPSLPDLSGLDSLTVATVYANKLTALWDFGAGQKKLYYLNASNNRLVSLPPSIGRLTALTNLFFQTNRLGDLPIEITALPLLNAPYFNVTYNQIYCVDSLNGNCNLSDSVRRWLDVKQPNWRTGQVYVGIGRGPLVHYKFDETVGTIVHDSSGNKFDGTLSGAVFLHSDSVSGGSVSLNGGSNYVRVSTKKMNELSAVSVALWFKSNSPRQNGTLFYMADTTASLNGNNFSISHYFGSFVAEQSKISVAQSRDSLLFRTWASPVITDNGWHHLVVTCAGPACSVKVFMDGIESTDYSGHNMFAHPMGLLKNTEIVNCVTLGFTPKPPSAYWDGKFDEFILWGRSLSSEEVLRLYHAYVPETDAAEKRDNHGLPTVFALHQNQPNPFNPATAIRYDIPYRSHAVNRYSTTLTVYNMNGQRLATLVDEMKGPGRYSTQWNGRDAKGRSLASGVYAYVLQSGSFIAQKKMIFVK